MSTLQNKNKKIAQSSIREKTDKSKNPNTPPHSSGKHKKRIQVQGKGAAYEQSLAKDKFEEIQNEHLQVAKKYAQNYESSSEEEELEGDAILESVFGSYGGDRNQSRKTQEFLENIFVSGASTCLICIGNVKRTDYVSHSNS